jgi:uncharacterized protein (TIGR00369 family)
VTPSFDPAEAGWQAIDAAAFVDLIGPIWRRRTPDGTLYGLVVTDKHGNRSGFAHGGVLTTLLDTALGLTSSDAQSGHKQATISLNVQFLAPVQLGDFIIVECQVVKATRTLMFMQGTLRARENVCALAQGTWKILRR